METLGLVLEKCSLPGELKASSFSGSNTIRWEDNLHRPDLADKCCSNHVEVLQWKRISKDFQATEGFSLWGKNGISVHDIR